MTRVRASPPYPKKARTRSLIVSQLIRFVPTEAQTVFALAAIHGHQELARAALKRMGESLEIVGNVDGASRSTGHLTGQAYRKRYPSGSRFRRSTSSSGVSRLPSSATTQPRSAKDGPRPSNVFMCAPLYFNCTPEQTLAALSTASFC
jgi:uncharacterized membrane protein